MCSNQIDVLGKRSYVSWSEKISSKDVASLPELKCSTVLSPSRLAAGVIFPGALFYGVNYPAIWNAQRVVFLAFGKRRVKPVIPGREFLHKRGQAGWVRILDPH